AEVENGLRRLVIVENGEIGLIEVANKFAALVSGDEQNVHFIDSFVDGEQRAGLVIVVRSGRFRSGSFRRGSCRSGRIGADTSRAAGVILGESRRCASKGESRQQRRDQPTMRVLHSETIQFLHAYPWPEGLPSY